MISPCTCSADGRAQLLGLMGVPTMGTPADEVNLEFRELPYFIVSRARLRREGQPMGAGDVAGMQILGANSLGLLVDPRLEDTPAEGPQRVFVPWTNVISVSFRTPSESLKGSTT
jgi:hypothetical protein